jgi:hypothetical protein
MAQSLKVKNYFTHDYYSREDIKLQQVLMEFGNEGYGVYWQMVEYLHEELGKIPNQPKILAHKFRTTELIINGVTAICFNIDGNYITSDRVNANIEYREGKQKEASKAGTKGAEKRWGKNRVPDRVAIGSDSKEKEKEISFSSKKENEGSTSIDEVSPSKAFEELFNN